MSELANCLVASATRIAGAHPAFIFLVGRAKGGDTSIEAGLAAGLDALLTRRNPDLQAGQIRRVTRMAMHLTRGGVRLALEEPPGPEREALMAEAGRALGAYLASRVI